MASKSEEATTGFSELWAETFSADRRQLATLFTNLLNGFTYNSIIVDKNGKPIDFVFHEVNAAFERMTEMHRDRVVSMKASESALVCL